jgi:uncharacterized protein YprB with RNaseH-like and TPR domain
VALYDGVRIRHYVNGENLDMLAGDLDRYRLLVTYNGTSFDLPFIRRYLGLPVEHAHLDLRYILARLGLTGGLKGCERALDLARADTAGLEGYHAVLLWDEWRRTGHSEALETLLAYNIQDTVSLEALMVHAYNARLQQTPLADLEPAAAPGAPPRSPCQADPDTVARLLAAPW